MNYLLRGKYLEDFVVGDVFFTPARTVSEADVCAFACLTGDFNPLHMNEEWAKEHSVFKTRIGHGMFGVALISGLINQTGMMEGTTIAVIETHIKFTGPLMIGDTVVARCTVTEVKPSSKPGRGVLKLDCDLVNQNDDVSVKQEIVLLVKTRES